MTVVNDGSITNSASSNYFYGAGHSGFVFQNAGSVGLAAGTELIIGDGAGDTVLNEPGGTINANGANSTLVVGYTAGTLMNAGLIEATGSGSTLDLATGTATWSNQIPGIGAGTVSATGGGAVNLGGSFSTAALSVGTFSESGTGSSLNITGALNNAGAMLEAPNGGGIFTLNGGTITGGTVDNTSAINPALTFGTGSASTLDGVTMSGNFTVPAYVYLHAKDNTLFTGGTANFASSIIYLSGPNPSTALTVGAGESLIGNLSIYAQASGMTVVNNGTITNTASTNYIYGNGSTGFVFANNGTAGATAGTELVLGDGMGDTVNNSAAGTIVASGASTVVAAYTNGAVSNYGLMEATGAGSTLDVATGGATWANGSSGTIEAVAGGEVNLGGNFSTSNLTVGHFIETGTGSSMNITGDLNNAGATLEAPNGGGIFTLNGGTITGGTVDNTSAITPALTFGTTYGSTLDGVAMQGNFSVPSGATFWVMDGTAFSGGTTTFTGSNVLLGGTAPGNALTISAGATWTGDFEIYAQSQSGLTVVNNGTMVNQSGGNYYYGAGNSGWSFTNNGTVNVPGGSLNIGNGGTDLVTNSSGATMNANGGTLELGNQSGTSFVNNGLLEATAGGTVVLGNTGGAWTNNGTITASGGGTVDFGGTYTEASLAGTINGAGGTLNLGGTLNNGSVLAAPTSGIFTLAGATINGGSVNGGALTFSNLGGTLNGVTMNGNFAFPSSGYASFAVQGTTIFTGGTTTFPTTASDSVNLSQTGAVLSLAPSETWTGSFGVYGYGSASNVTLLNQGNMLQTAGDNSIWGNGNGFTLQNSGQLTVNAGVLQLGYYANDSVQNLSGGTITANNATIFIGNNLSSFTNAGTLLATNNGTLVIGGALHTSDLGGSISATLGGILDLAGTLNNTSAVLAAPAAGVYTLDGGTITGGTVASGALTFGGYDGTLDGVAMTGNFAVPNSSSGFFTAKNNTTFSGGTMTFGTTGNYEAELSGTGTALTIASNDTWSGYFGVYGTSAGVNFLNQGTMNFAGGYIYSNSLGMSITNGGVIDNSTGTLQLGYYAGDSFTNQPGGTVDASGGTTYVGDYQSTDTNLSAGTLAGGTWVAAGSGILSFEGTSPIDTIASGTVVELSGPSSVIRTRSGAGSSYQNIEQTLTVVDGTLGVLANRNFASTSAGITNNGVVELGGGTLTAASLTSNPGSSLVGYGTFGPTGGVTVGSGALVSPGVNVTGTYIGTLSFNSLALGSGGSMQFDIKNSSAPVAGTDNDTLAVAGNLNVTASPGTPFTISLESINPGTGAPGLANFNMAQSYQWTLASAGSISNFNPADFSINTSSFANSLGATGYFTVTAGANDIYLNFLPVPEPSTWALIAAGVLMIACAAWRRRPAKALR
jgi:hypothetical protein